MLLNGPALNVAVLNGDATVSGSPATAVASGFSTASFGVPTHGRTQQIFGTNTPTVITRTPSIASARFDSAEVISDFVGGTWTVELGTIAGGRVGDFGAVGSFEVQTFPAQPVPVSGGLQVDILFTPVTPALNSQKLGIIFTYSTNSLQVQYRFSRSSLATDNEELLLVHNGGAVNVFTRTTTQAPLVPGQQYSFRAISSSTSTEFYLDGSLLHTFPNGSATTTVSTLGLSGFGTYADDLIFVDTLPVDVTTPATLAPTTRLGSPGHTLINPAASLGVITTFGAFASPSLQACAATGESVTAFGSAYSSRYSAPVVNRSAAASATMTIVFGLPATMTVASGTTAGGATTTFGLPRAMRSQPATAAAPMTEFGTVSAANGAQTSGAQATSFGAPTSRRSTPASSTYRATRWGTHLTTRSNTFMAAGTVARGRFGRPSAQRLSASSASGTSSSMFGTPACIQRYRAFHIYPGTRLGKPFMTRNPPC